MTTTTTPPAPGGSTGTPADVPMMPRTGARHRWSSPDAVLAVAAALSATSLAVSLVGLVVDDQVVTGAPAWLKPAKFGISVTLYVLTLRWVLGRVTGHGRLVRVVAAVTAVALVGELVLIDLQAGRGTTSHFNVATTLDAAVYEAMGAMIATVFLVALASGVLVLRQRGLDAGLAAGLRWGIGVSLLGMAEAGTMIANHGWDPDGGHTVGARDGGPGLPVTGWSTLHGDLRIGHFVGLHALQLLPLLAWALARWTPLGERTRARLVAVAGAGQAGLVVLLTWQALRGQALLHPDALTAGAAAVLALAVAAAATAVVASGRRRSAPLHP